MQWSIVGQQRRAVEDLLPPWTVKNPCYQATEFQSWSEVARLFEPHYRGTPLPSDILEELSRLASNYPEKIDQAVEWLRFVQRELRYFALSLGDGGLVPRELDAIWANRFGDCKDAVRLYVSGALSLGIDACAALVSTTHGLSLGDFLPSTQVFNHVIVRLRLQDATYWLDPTAQRQGGSLGQIVQLHAGRALPLTTDTTELERLPAAEPVQHIHCEDTIEFGPKPGSPAIFQRQIDFQYWSADGMRGRIENEGPSKFSAQLLQELHATWPQIVEIAPVVIRDDPIGNRITALFNYEIRDCWKPSEKKGRLGFSIADNFTVKELGVLKSTRRDSEIFLGRPRTATWTARMKMPREWHGAGWHHLIEESGLHLRSELSIDGHYVKFERRVSIDTWSIAADQADAYSRVIAKLANNAAKLWARVLFGRIHPAAGGWFGLAAYRWRIVWFAFWLLFILFNFLGKNSGRH